MEKKNNLKLTYMIIGVTILSLLTALATNMPMYLGLLSGLIFSAVVASTKGHDIKNILKMIIAGCKQSLIIFLLMSLIGMLIGIWMAGGTVPSMIHYGFTYLTNTNLILAAFISCTVISLIMGTAFGAISTIGTVFLSLAIGLNIPLAPLVGAIVSGSFFGDRTSPLSGSLNLNSVMTETRVLDNIKHMNYTTIPTYGICILLYLFIGNKFTGNFSDSSEILHLQMLLDSNFNIDLISLVSPIIILLCAVALKLPILKSILAGLFVSIIIYILRDQGTIIEVFNYIIFGYHPENMEIARMISGGGFQSMINVVLIILSSSGLIGILEGTNMIDPLIDNFTKTIKTPTNLIHKTSLLCISITTITCNQSLSIIIPGHYLKTVYDDFKISRNTLARTISDVGVIIVPLIPWNVNALFVVSVTGVPTLEYLPYSFSCYIPLILTFIYPMIAIKNTGQITTNKKIK